MLPPRIVLSRLGDTGWTRAVERIGWLPGDLSEYELGLSLQLFAAASGRLQRTLAAPMEDQIRAG